MNKKYSIEYNIKFFLLDILRFMILPIYLLVPDELIDGFIKKVPNDFSRIIILILSIVIIFGWYIFISKLRYKLINKK